MTKRTIPYLFLAVLLGVLLFVVGVRYGQRVEQVNKTVKYLISIAPSPTLVPTKTPTTFSEYTHTGCKVSFLLPSDLELTKESSNSALFVRTKSQLALAVTCEKKPFQKSDKELSTSLNKTIRAYETKTNDTASYRFYHTNTTQVVTLTVEKSLAPLIQKSLTIGQ